MRIAFLGLGIMGHAMATNLVKAGHEVATWNRSPGKIVEGTRAKDGGTHGNARSVYMASTGKKLGAGSSEGVTP